MADQNRHCDPSTQAVFGEVRRFQKHGPEVGSGGSYDRRPVAVVMPWAGSEQSDTLQEALDFILFRKTIWLWVKTNGGILQWNVGILQWSVIIIQ